MKRLWIPAILILLLIGICSAGLTTVNQATVQMEETLSAARLAAENGDNQRAEALSRQAVEDWNELHTKLCTFMPHTRLEDIEQNLAVLAPLIHSDSTDQFLAECDRCTTQILYLNETEIPSLENIL